MVTFRNNNNNLRRNNFRRNDRGFKSNGDRPKYATNFSNNENFQRNIPSRNNHNAPKLIEKYNEMAREALANEDRVLSENYFQHADHFTRVLNEQESLKKARYSENKAANADKPEVLDEKINSDVVEKKENIKVSKSQSEAS